MKFLSGVAAVKTAIFNISDLFISPPQDFTSIIRGHIVSCIPML